MCSRVRCAPWFVTDRKWAPPGVAGGTSLHICIKLLEQMVLGRSWVVQRSGVLPASEKRRSNPDLAIANLPLTFFPSRCLVDCVLGSVKFGNAELCHFSFWVASLRVFLGINTNLWDLDSQKVVFGLVCSWGGWGKVGKGAGERCDKQFSRRKIPT